MNKPTPRGARELLAAVSAVFLFLPASASLPIAQLNLQRSARLWHERRVSPDIGSDLEYRELVRLLPPTGVIGFHNVSGRDGQLLRFRLQYALPPRRIVRWSGREYVIEYGPAGHLASLTRNSNFVLVGALNDDLRVFRSIRP